MNASIVPILPHPGRPHLPQQRKPFTECLDTRNASFYPSFRRWGIKLACVSPNLVRNPDGSQDQVTAETWEWCGDNKELGVHHKSVLTHSQSWPSQNTEPVFLRNSESVWQNTFFLSLVIFIWCLGLQGKVISTFQTFLCSHHYSCSV